MCTQGSSPASRVAPAVGTGRGVKVAIIDSGINAQHSHVQRVEGGTQVCRGRDGALNFLGSWHDSIGHGTALAGILRAKSPSAHLYSVKVFDKRLQTDAEVVAAAIRWVADQNIEIANCSLGTENAADRALLQAACDYATARGVLLVASTDGEARELLPACLAGIIAVTGDERCAWNEYYFSVEKGVFLAHPHPRPLPGRPQRFNLQGHSFAAAHVAARIACVRELHPSAGREEILCVLKAGASPPAVMEAGHVQALNSQTDSKA
jgi:subtilase family protein